jgi:hypothetical protein
LAVDIEVALPEDLEEQIFVVAPRRSEQTFICG